MEKEQTLRVLQALANGTHPVTGEQFPTDGPYHHPEVLRALYESIRIVQGASVLAAAPAHRAGPSSGGTGNRWTPEEEERLANAFDAGKSVDEIVRGHNRSRAAIEARLVKLGRLDPSAVTVPLRYPPRPPGNQTRQSS